ncbi:pro-resilin-like isoform X1 [Pieris napi]|uniref:pro-resilin-like isoform X1 n=1 Tax=Pieris napi TaxID=78633 RepID=UPI001FBB6405|nr:pro-resilin-like isoform X1 [Pieris napi]
MKTFLIIAVTALAVVAEPPISKSYLPPPPGGRAGYSQGSPSGPAFQAGIAPEIIAARTLTGAGLSNGFARSGTHDHTIARFNGNQHGYDSAIPVGRNAIEQASEPANYNFGYMVNDVLQGTEFGHREERQEETAEGEYHVVLPDGRKQTVSYKADERGFKPQISYEDTEDLTSGYDVNAQNRGSNEHDSNGGRNHHDSGFGSHGNRFGNHDNGFNGGHGNHGNARSGY